MLRFEYSIGIASYNRPLLVKRLLDSIKELDFKKVLIVDESNEDEFLEVLSLAKFFKVDLIRKDRQRGVANSWNLVFLYTPTRYVILACEDVYVKPEANIFEYFDEAFRKKFYRAALMRSDIVGMDKSIIPLVGWYDERFIKSHCEDTDYVLRMREKLGILDWTVPVCFPSPKPIREFENEYVVHDRWKYRRYWVEDMYSFTKREGSSPVEKYFLEKWEIDREKLENIFPGSTKNKNDYELIAIAGETNSVKRKLPEIDFYPEVTERYRKGNFGVYERLVNSVGAYYVLGGQK